MAGFLAGLLLVLALSAWLVPPLLDWGRYRSTIAAIAAARLGRPVAIGGTVSLRLLPHAVLTATDVTLPDQGDGLSGRLATLRLQVAIGALLSGRIAATDLVLGAPILRLPWPLPAAMTAPLRPPAPRGFGARVENGSLEIGRLALVGINATLVGDASAGSLRASGEAGAGGLPWRFRAVLGAPGETGASRVEVAVAGQDRLRDTGGTLKAVLSGAELAGNIDCGGGDLSLLLNAGPRLPWRVHGAMTAARDRIAAPALVLEARGGAAQARAALSLVLPRLELAIVTPAFAPALWAPLAARASSSGLAFDLDLAAERAALLDDQVTGLDLHIVGDGAALRLERARAMLPGGATATLSGVIGSSASGSPYLSGPAALDAPDPRTTLHWLRKLAPNVADAVPDPALAHVVLRGQWRLAAGGFEAQVLNGSLGDDRFDGRFALRLGPRPGVTADLRFDRLALGAALPTTPGLPSRLADPGFDADVHLRAASSALWGLSLTDVSLDAKAGAGGVQVRQASASLAGTSVALAGSLSTDGTLSDGRLSAEIHDLKQLMAAAPAGWASAAPLWHGRATVEVSVSGPRDALALQFRAGAGDLRVEVESLLDATLRTASATVTLRHPGAPRLLADLGLPGAQAWLDTGSVALLCHLRLTPGHVVAQDFEINAATLRAAGKADIDLSGTIPNLAASLRAETLPLPDWTSRRTPELPGWALKAEARLHVEADEVLAGLRSVAGKASADITLNQGMVLAEPIGAVVAGGRLSASFAADLSPSPPRVALHADLNGATVQGPLTGLPIDPVDAAFDLSAMLETTGASPATLTGAATATVRATAIAGLDFPRLAQSLVLPQGEREPAVRAAISSGTSTGFEGSVELGIAGSSLIFRRGLLIAPSGTLNISGSIDLAAETADLHLVGRPAVASPPSIGVDLSGSWAAARRSDTLGEALDWGQHPKARPPSVAKPKRKRRRP